jgi:hypothetical protein
MLYYIIALHEDNKVEVDQLRVGGIGFEACPLVSPSVDQIFSWGLLRLGRTYDLVQSKLDRKNPRRERAGEDAAAGGSTTTKSPNQSPRLPNFPGNRVKHCNIVCLGFGLVINRRRRRRESRASTCISSGSCPKLRSAESDPSS